MTSVDRQFQRRAAVIPKLGLGLSVDVYSPDLWVLMDRLDAAAARPAYLEIFRAAPTVLKAVRQSFAGVPLAYHGEGLWVTQPEFRLTPVFEQELDGVALELNALGSPWLNHECATKQMGGYSFGTYLPPLYTPESAYLVADNIGLVQERLDRDCTKADSFGPLFLLEMPPLTYFMAGTLEVAEYFRLIVERTPCGLVLDIQRRGSTHHWKNSSTASSMHFRWSALSRSTLPGWQFMNRILPLPYGIKIPNGSTRMPQRFLPYPGGFSSKSSRILGSGISAPWPSKWIPSRSSALSRNFGRPSRWYSRPSTV